MEEEQKKFLQRLWGLVTRQQRKKGISDEELNAMLNAPTPPETEKKVIEGMQELGRHLKNAREMEGLSVEELAKKARVPISSIQLLEAGLANLPITEVYRVMKALRSSLKFSPRKD